MVRGNHDLEVYGLLAIDIKLVDLVAAFGWDEELLLVRVVVVVGDLLAFKNGQAIVNGVDLFGHKLLLTQDGDDVVFCCREVLIKIEDLRA